MQSSSIFPRCNRALKYIDAKYIKKASQWCILNRKHAELIIQSNEYIEWFKNTVGDEHCYITYLYYLGLQDELIQTLYSAESATTFTNWSDMIYKYADIDKYPLSIKSKNKNKNKNKIHLKNYDKIENEELMHLIGSKCLFGRKFSQICDLSLLQNVLLNHAFTHTDTLSYTVGQLMRGESRMFDTGSIVYVILVTVFLSIGLYYYYIHTTTSTQ
jgi:hypothetical protein